MAGGRRVRMAFWALWRRLAPRRSGLLVFLGGCGLAVAGTLGRRWVGKYQLSIRLLTEESLAELSEDLFLSWLAYHYLNVLSIAGVLAGLLICLTGLVWVVRARYVSAGPVEGICPEEQKSRRQDRSLVPGRRAGGDAPARYLWQGQARERRGLRHRPAEVCLHLHRVPADNNSRCGSAYCLLE